MIEAANQIEEIASRAIALYSRPTVAMELVRLTEEPCVDANRLKECVAQDPALTCKILRVVNSSLFGLNRPVADLNQAIGLLGIKPLKLLVLGFSLPDALFAELAARELRWYWTNTLTRAVAARLLAEQLWNQAGDEAFIAGLLQDIGVLVLLRELGEPYARFLTGVIDEKCHLASLEQDTLGFDHVQLSAALLARWQLPKHLVDAIAMPKRAARLARMDSPAADLPQILHLAEMLMQLVGQGRLQVLPELLEAGKKYRGMTKPKLAALVEGLQPQVDQLGQVLSLELNDARDYKQTLLDAHRQMAMLSEQIAGEPAHNSTEDRTLSHLLGFTRELSNAMQTFLGRKTVDSEPGAPSRRGLHAAHESNGKTPAAKAHDYGHSTTASVFARKLVAAATRCRDRRHELSLIVMEPDSSGTDLEPRSPLTIHQARRALNKMCDALDRDNVTLVSLSKWRTAAIIADCERSAALDLAHNTIAELDRIELQSSDAVDAATTILSFGVATASVIPENFDPAQMVERAMGCLSAARTCGISAVKSIEV